MKARLPKTYILRRGATLRWTGVVTDDDDNPIDITNYELRSQVRSQDGSLIADATFSMWEQYTSAGMYDAWFPPTTGWPLERLIWDVMMVDVDTGDILISETDYIRVERAATEYVAP